MSALSLILCAMLPFAITILNIQEVKGVWDFRLSFCTCWWKPPPLISQPYTISASILSEGTATEIIHTNVDKSHYTTPVLVFRGFVKGVLCSGFPVSVTTEVLPNLHRALMAREATSASFQRLIFTPTDP